MILGVRELCNSAKGTQAIGELQTGLTSSGTQPKKLALGATSPSETPLFQEASARARSFDEPLACGQVAGHRGLPR